MTRRESAIFACLCETVVDPGPELPAVAVTDAVASFATTLQRSPLPNRLGLRALLTAIDLAPLAVGERRPLRHLTPERRTAALTRFERTTAGGAIVKAMRGIAHLSYYGDLTVMDRLGYDPTAVVARAQAVRVAEARW